MYRYFVSYEVVFKYAFMYIHIHTTSKVGAIFMYACTFTCRSTASLQLLLTSYHVLYIIKCHPSQVGVLLPQFLGDWFVNHLLLIKLHHTSICIYYHTLYIIAKMVDSELKYQ